MKSMSIWAQGKSRLYCVCKCRIGFCNTFSPLIHIFDGENVWHQVMTPMQFLELFASMQMFVISSGPVITGLNTTLTGIFEDLLKKPAISLECSSTFFSVSGPYRCWLPVTNQTSNFFRSGNIEYSFM